MKSMRDPGPAGTPITPRRRAAPEPVVDQGGWERGLDMADAAHQSASDTSDADTPVLLRLPDLNPSPAMDAAVRRLERQTAAASRSAATSAPTAPSSTPSSSSNKTQAQAHAQPKSHSSERTPSPEPRAKTDANMKPSMDWNNRIIVTTFIVTLVASAYMVFQRATREHADSQRVRTPAVSADDLAPIPSRRIDRGSFQADARTRDVGNARRKRHRLPAVSTGSASRIDSYSTSQTDNTFEGTAVSYEAPDENVRRLAEPKPQSKQSYDLQSTNTDSRPYEPRVIPLREVPE